MSSITPELQAQFFPLLDDMGGKEEIYTIEELKSRISTSRAMPPKGVWYRKWLKGVEWINSYKSEYDSYITIRVCYYGLVYDFKLHELHLDSVT